MCWIVSAWPLQTSLPTSARLTVIGQSVVLLRLSANMMSSAMAPMRAPFTATFWKSRCVHRFAARRLRYSELVVTPDSPTHVEFMNPVDALICGQSASLRAMSIRF
eukprot:Amastigsp_a510381_6.p3 type:complete len:106 gc:universal Amastigsp_a510381_6:534-851(+)